MTLLFDPDDVSHLNPVYSMPFITECVVLFLSTTTKQSETLSLKTKANKPDIAQWSPLFRFCRAMRNAAVHKGGRVDFINPNVVAVEWYDLKYGWADKGAWR